jgi:hypothetical protein
VEITQEQRTSSIRAILDGLVLERQRLRRSTDGAALLEANRRSIVYWQAELSRALLAERGQDDQ